MLRGMPEEAPVNSVGVPTPRAGLAGGALVMLDITAAVPFVLGGAIVWLLLWTILSGLPGAAAARDYRGAG